jgi:hypothetical protein
MSAERAYATLKLSDVPNADIPESITQHLSDLIDLCEEHELDFNALCVAAEFGRDMFDHDDREPNAGPRYSGWDRIHNDNKAEGRPTGDQWPHRRA